MHHIRSSFSSKFSLKSDENKEYILECSISGFRQNFSLKSDENEECGLEIACTSNKESGAEDASKRASRTDAAT